MLQKALREVGAEIAQYAGRETKVPNMRNGRCFPTSIALCHCSPEMLAQWLQIPRNDVTSTPIRLQNFNKVTDTSRHDFEVAFAKESAQNIFDLLLLCPDVAQPINNGILQRLCRPARTLMRAESASRLNT